VASRSLYKISEESSNFEKTSEVGKWIYYIQFFTYWSSIIFVLIVFFLLFWLSLIKLFF
jgi:hypothetical protein